MRLRILMLVVAVLAPALLLLRDRQVAVTFALSAVGALGLGAILAALVSLVLRIRPATFPAGPALGWAARAGLGALALLCLLSVLLMTVAAVDQLVIAATGSSLIVPG
jgi:hypothetical protein